MVVIREIYSFETKKYNYPTFGAVKPRWVHTV